MNHPRAAWICDTREGVQNGPGGKVEEVDYSSYHRRKEKVRIRETT